MYKYNHSKLFKLLVGFLVIFVWMINHTTGFDLAEQIYSKFNDVINKGYGDVFIVNSYSPNISKDPYGEALSSIESRSMQLKIAGAQQVEHDLQDMGCNLTQKEIWGTLYYFVPEFRAELATSLKQTIGNYDSKNYVFADGQIAQYCGKFYDCKNTYQNSVSEKCKNQKLKCDNIGKQRDDKKKACEDNKKMCDTKKRESYDKCLNSCYDKIASTSHSVDCREECGDKYKSKECDDEYNKCNSEYNEYSSEYNKCNTEYNKCINDWGGREINGRGAADVMTACKEFFKSKYKGGQEDKELMQEMDSQVGAEKYWNNTTEDSPYDIMSDLAVLAKLLYRDAQEPIITPTLYKTSVSYKMPNFGNAGGGNGSSSTSSDRGQSILDGGREKQGDIESDSSVNRGLLSERVEGSNEVGNSEGSVSLTERSLIEREKGGERATTFMNGDSSKQVSRGNTDQGVDALPISDDLDGGYDKLVEGLNVLGLESKDSKIFSNLCEDDDELIEPDELGQGLSEDENEEEDIIKFSDLSDEEYQEIVDSMLDAVDKYATLPKEIEDKIKKDASSRTNSILNSTTPEDLKDTANKIKNCYASCEGLRIDQKASCMLKCSCGEIESPIFDPEKTPGLGPIFVIRFCGVPATSTSFSVGGKRIYSIEEGLYEIYGALDKLSREGKLGTWTQQNEFLDSSTKKMNIAKTFAFSISVEFVNIANNMGKNDIGSTKVEEREAVKKAMEDDNNYALSNYGIMNDLRAASSKNAYSVIGGGGKVSTVGQEKSLSVNEKPKSEDLVADANADRYGEFEENFALFVDQQSSLWKKVVEAISSLNDSAQYLYKKKCSSK